MSFKFIEILDSVPLQEKRRLKIIGLLHLQYCVTVFHFLNYLYKCTFTLKVWNYFFIYVTKK